MNKSTSSQIKSKKRVQDHGEVFTAEREVKAMCNLVNDETRRLDSRFLEPACGDGNFLVEILSRKLEVLKRQYKKSQNDFEKYSVITVGSLYGVELLSDNAKLCRKRLFKLWKSEYENLYKKNCNKDFEKVIEFILEKNILCGNALTLKQVDSNQKDSEKPIIFCEWNIVPEDKIKRRDFRLDELLNGNTDTPDLFMNDWTFDKETKTFIPNPIKEFPPIHFRRIAEYE